MDGKKVEVTIIDNFLDEELYEDKRTSVKYVGIDWNKPLWTHGIDQGPKTILSTDLDDFCIHPNEEMINRSMGRVCPLTELGHKTVEDLQIQLLDQYTKEEI